MENDLVLWWENVIVKILIEYTKALSRQITIVDVFFPNFF